MDKTTEGEIKSNTLMGEGKVFYWQSFGWLHTGISGYRICMAISVRIPSVRRRPQACSAPDEKYLLV